MNTEKYARLLEGRQTLNTIMEITKLKKTSCLNIISKLKKHGYLKKTGGRQQTRIYIINQKKIQEGSGMFDILNKYAKEKVIPPFQHIAHSKYSVEDALVDLIKLNITRININILPLFNHVKDWSYLYSLSKKNKMCRNVGLLYDVARATRKIRKMPVNIYKRFLASKEHFKYRNIRSDFKGIEKEWKLKVPFTKKDII